MKPVQILLTLFAIVGGVWGAMFALDERFVSRSFATSMQKQIQATTKRLEVKIVEDKIFYAEREKWEKIKRHGPRSIEARKAQSKIDRLKRSRPK